MDGINQQHFNDSLKLSLNSYLKTGNPIVDAMISTIIISFLTYLAKLLFESDDDVQTLFKLIF